MLSYTFSFIRYYVASNLYLSVLKPVPYPWQPAATQNKGQKYFQSIRSCFTRLNQIVLLQYIMVMQYFHCVRCVAVIKWIRLRHTETYSAFFSKKNIAVFTPQQRKRENRKRRPRILIYSQSMKKFAAIYFLRAASVLPLIVQNSLGAVRYCWAEQAQALKMIYRYRLSVRRDKWRVELTRNTIWKGTRHTGKAWAMF